MEFVDRLTEVLEARGWTPYQWAQRAELSDATVANMITRRAKGARPQTLRALAKTAAVSFEWLASGEGPSGLDRSEPAPSHQPDDHVQPPAAEGSPLERALGEAFDPKRHTVTDLRAVQDALGSTYRWERPEADLLAAARTWLDPLRLLAELPGAAPAWVILRAAWVARRAVIVRLASERWTYAPDGGELPPAGAWERDMVAIVRRTERPHRTLLGDEAWPVGFREHLGVVIALRL